MNLSDTLELGVAIKEDVVRMISLTDPTAIYPERPYKYADPDLTEAYDLTLADPVNLARRPENGWCYGRPPGIDAGRWPISATNGMPLRHAFTVKLPPQYRTLGNDVCSDLALRRRAMGNAAGKQECRSRRRGGSIRVASTWNSWTTATLSSG